MLRGCVMSSMQMLSAMAPQARGSALLAGNPWLQVTPLKRNMTGGAVREAAKTAKATLLRTNAVANPVQVDRRHGAAAPGFVDLAVDDRVLGRLAESSVQAPTAVQQAAIPAVLSGKNVALQCYTGSGKTLAYLLPVLSQAIQRAEEEFRTLQKQGKEHEAGGLQALVIVPSRELAMQIVRVAQGLIAHDARGTIQQCIGGANPHRQAEALKINKPLMVVGTPGRLTELSRMGRLQIHHCHTLILDEVDQLLEYHFEEDMTRLTEHCGKKVPGGRQTIIVSATLKDVMLQKTSKWCPRPDKVFISPAGQLVGTEAAPTAQLDNQQQHPDAASATAPVRPPPDLPPQLTHMYLETTRRHRVDAVRRLIYAADLQRVLVFMNQQQTLQDTQLKLSAKGMPVGCLHGELDKSQRQNELARFKRGEQRALIVSDVAARGLDVPDCDAVINLELPSGPDHYAHRAGRTGRAGRKGMVVSIAEPDTLFVIGKMCKSLQMAIPKATLTDGVLEVEDKQSSVQQVSEV